MYSLTFISTGFIPASQILQADRGLFRPLFHAQNISEEALMYVGRLLVSSSCCVSLLVDSEMYCLDCASGVAPFADLVLRIRIRLISLSNLLVSNIPHVLQFLPLHLTAPL